MSMRISAIIANLFKNENSKIELFSIPTAKFLSEKANFENKKNIPIFLQLNNSEIFTFFKNEKDIFEEKIFSREDLENNFSNWDKKNFYYWILKKWLFDFENFFEIEEKNLVPDKKILKSFEENFSKSEKFLTNKIKIFYWK